MQTYLNRCIDKQDNELLEVRNYDGIAPMSIRHHMNMCLLDTFCNILYFCIPGRIFADTNI